MKRHDWQVLFAAGRVVAVCPCGTSTSGVDWFDPAGECKGATPTTHRWSLGVGGEYAALVAACPCGTVRRGAVQTIEMGGFPLDLSGGDCPAAANRGA